jgi:electron transfer flavoprotein beta subunit
VKILVAIKQVSDPDQASRIRVLDDGRVLDCSELDRYANPFDEYALETALRLTEDGESPRHRIGEVIAVSFGDERSELVLRAALAVGASRGIRVAATDEALDAHLVATALAHLAQVESVDLVILGKQSVDGDGNEVAQRVAGLMDLPQLTGVSAIDEHSDGTLIVTREVEGGLLRVRTRPPAIMSVDLRVVLPCAVYSPHTRRDFEYPAGFRFASLPSIIAARRKQLEQLPLSALTGSAERTLVHSSFKLQTRRDVCTMVASVEELRLRLAERAPAIHTRCAF